MIKVKALEDFTLGRIKEVKNLVRYQDRKHQENKIEYKDIFECEKDLAYYLLNEKGFENPINRPVVEVIEIIPEKETELQEEKEEESKVKTKKTITRKRRKLI